MKFYMHIAYGIKSGLIMSSSGIRSRISHAQWSLKPQDLAMALKLVSANGWEQGYKALAGEMQLSPFEAHACLTRLVSAKLATSTDGKHVLVKAAFRPLLLSGAPYFFPAVRGEITVGFPTAHGAEPLKSEVLFAHDMPPVWPHPEGEVRGTSLLPLYPKLPLAAAKDAKLYELLALFDALRIGQARERELAKRLLEERLA